MQHDSLLVMVVMSAYLVYLATFVLLLSYGVINLGVLEEVGRHTKLRDISLTPVDIVMVLGATFRDFSMVIIDPRGRVVVIVYCNGAFVALASFP